MVHLASGLVAGHLGTDVGEALVRLRATVFGSDRAFSEVAKDVVDVAFASMTARQCDRSDDKDH